ncbi:MAG TPA: class I SAM-dependent methyltransferase [Patescibacteria group bacterium]|nr:class I SAM-dependent methyltransferase [Patescibacteria group bacterium]
MPEKTGYQDYVKNYVEQDSETSLMKRYGQYQEKYVANMRESDRVIVAMIAAEMERQKRNDLAVLDIGCSTGNLLFHLKNIFPDLKLTGGDLSQDAIDACKSSERLQGIVFKKMDFLAIEGEYDIIIANAASFFFSWEEYNGAMASVAKALKSGGIYISFDLMHPFKHQDIQITETTRTHTKGVTLYFRPYARVEEILKDNTFKEISFKNFDIPIDLPFIPANDESDGFDDLLSYTKKTEGGERLLFRGALYQPWCHMSARKA